MFFPHLGSPMRKSTFKEVWDTYEKQLNMVCCHKFRTPYDVQQQIFTLWDIVKGEFFPVNQDYFGRLFNINDVEVIRECLDSEKDLMICLNDNGDINDNNFETIKEEINELLRKKFPKKSEYEV